MTDHDPGESSSPAPSVNALKIAAYSSWVIDAIAAVVVWQVAGPLIGIIVAVTGLAACLYLMRLANNPPSNE